MNSGRLLAIVITSSLLAGYPHLVFAQIDGKLQEKPMLLAAALPAGKVSSDGEHLLKLLDLQASLDRIQRSKAALNTIVLPNSLEGLACRQDLLEAREELSRRIMKANLEVDYVLSAIDGEQNHYTERIQELSAKRDKAVWYSTIFSQWSNGILWCGSSSFTVASVKRPTLSYADGILGILAGAIPTVLSLYAMHQSHGGKVDSVVNPNMLAPVFERASIDSFFPSVVAAYLKEVPPGAKDAVSRRERLKARWSEMGYLDKPGTPAYERMVAVLTASEARKKAMTISIYQNRQQMLEDLRTEVFQMKRLLVELAGLIN